MSACICVTPRPTVHMKMKWIASSRTGWEAVSNSSLCPVREETTALKALVEQANLQRGNIQAHVETFQTAERFRDLMSLFILQGDLQLALKHYQVLEQSQKEKLWKLFQYDVFLFKQTTEALGGAAREVHAHSEEMVPFVDIESLKGLYCQVLLLTTRVRLPLFLEMYEEAEWDRNDCGKELPQVYKQLFRNNFLILSMLRSIFVRLQCEDELNAIDPMAVVGCA